MSYWKNRQEQLKQAAEKDEAKLRKRLSTFFDAEFKRLEKEIAAYYQAYGQDKVIEYRRLLQSLPEEDKRLLIERMEEFQKKYPQYADLMPVRESIYRLDRLQGLQYSLVMTQAEIAAYTSEQIREYVTKLARQGVNGTMEALGFGKNFYSIDSEVVKQFVNVPWCDGENFSIRIWNDTQKLARYLSQDLAQGFARGDSYEKLVRQLQKRFGNVNRRDAYRLVYTEGTYVMAESSIQPFTADFTRYKVSPVLDGKTCPICRGIMERVFEIADRKPGVNFPPFHPWCRCSFEIVVDDWDRWMDDYAAKHGGDKKQAEQVEKRLNSSPEGGIIKLPKYEKAVIPKAKFTQYALNPDKDVNKARAFELALGYTMENADDLIAQIREKLPKYHALEKGDRGWGMTYEVIMNITGPNGKTAKVLTAWVDDKINGEMRLTTVHIDN